MLVFAPSDVVRCCVGVHRHHAICRAGPLVILMPYVKLKALPNAFDNRNRSRNRNICVHLHQSGIVVCRCGFDLRYSLCCCGPVLLLDTTRLALDRLQGLKHARPGAYLGFRICAMLASHDCSGRKGVAIRIEADRVFLK